MSDCDISKVRSFPFSDVERPAQCTEEDAGQGGVAEPAHAAGSFSDNRQTPNIPLATCPL
jgi:hypothetical protein